MRRCLLLLGAVLLLGGFVNLDEKLLLSPPPDCRAPAEYAGAAIQARRLAWSRGHFSASFLLQNLTPEPLVINGLTADGLILNEFELISPAGPRYYDNWKRRQGVFRREGFPPLAPNAVAESKIEFDARRDFYILIFNRQMTARGETELKRAAFACSVPG